jgi:hypothetical protein
MLRGLIAAVLLALGGCATAMQPPRPASAAPAARTVVAEVVRDGDAWTAEFRFDRPSPAWLFAHSAVKRVGGQPWRPGSWTVETPGVRIERRGRHDVLFAERGAVPPVVRVRFVPVDDDLVAEYDPALIFTDGSVALWSGHFHLLPVASVEAAAALPLDLNGIPFSSNGSEVTFRDRRGRVFYVGRRLDSATLIDGKFYVLFGPLEPAAGEGIATLLDPGLPAWLKRELGEATPAIFRHLESALGPHAGPMPTLLVNWRGATPGLVSMGGSVLPGQIGMTFEGIGVTAESRSVRDDARGFIAHEAVHFWLGNTVRYQAARDSWITEGGADLLAQRTLAAIDPGFDPRPKLQRLIAECAAFARRPVAEAAERGENQAFYACGAVFGMVAEAASRRPFAAFVRGLVDSNRADGVLTRAEWLAALDRLSGDPSLSRDIAILLDRGSPDAKAVIASLFTRSGVRFTPGADGVPRLP